MLAIKRFAMSAGLVASLVVALAAPASASWVEQFSAIPSGASSWDMGAVSCSGPTTCMALGGFEDNSGGHLLAEQLTGSTWSVVGIPDPGAGNLGGISCTSATSCEAVGFWVNGSTTQTLAEVWNGSSWSIQTTPNPSGATSAQFNDVSCKSATACEAVGSWFDGTTTSPLAARWNGSNWSLQTTPSPSGATLTQLKGVSCPNASDCEATGSSRNGSTTTTLAELWNGSSWSIQTTPNASGTFSQLEGVSCTSATACTAVGTGLAERWNGSSWTLQLITKPKEVDLLRVSCTDANTCMAAGIWFQDAVEQQTAEQWDGTKWTVKQTPLSTSSDSQGFSDISCTFATNCTAVGFYHDPVTGNRALIENWTIRWQLNLPAIPSGSIGGGLQAISCHTSTACQAVGDSEFSGSVFTPTVEGWNGSTWTVENTPSPDISNLSGISCSAVKQCTAVGDRASGSNLITLAERWNGSTWTDQTTPNPSGTVSNFLISVSCASSKACMAVGFDRDGSGNQATLAESWNGTTWKLLTTPNPAGSTTAQLNTVSCVSSTACEAIGTDNTKTWAEVWNGSTWTIQTTPTPSGGTNAKLFGLSCTAANACTAVGSYNNGKLVPLAERWNGTNWTPQTVPNPGGSGAGFLQVSCSASLHNLGCSAVGFHVQSGVTNFMAEQWNGTNWQVKPVQVPSGALQSSLSGVSCSAQTSCMAVGFWEDNTGFEAPVAQQYS